MIKNKRIQRIIELLNTLLPIIFWMSLIFGMEEKNMAISTVAAALIHECGHIIYLALVNENANIRGVLFGFSIRSNALLSYHQEMMMYLWGPLSNILASTILLFPCMLLGGFFQSLTIANIITALSNLLPIKGYDGYGILRSQIMKNDSPRWAIEGLEALSSLLIFSLCMFSLYLIDRHGGGYWIFAIFFISMIKEMSRRLDNIKTEN